MAATQAHNHPISRNQQISKKYVLSVRKTTKSGRVLQIAEYYARHAWMDICRPRKRKMQSLSPNNQTELIPFTPRDPRGRSAIIKPAQSDRVLLQMSTLHTSEQPI